MAVPSAGATLQPFFLDTPGGRRFAVHHRPPPGAPWRGHVLCAAPFNEEMNRCRSMVTLQALEWARLGFGTLVLDLQGTGDSEGHYGDGRWSGWLDDLRAGQRWLAAQPGGCRGLMGIRLGAMLAAELHAELADADVALMLWQPVVDGKLHMNQFMRLRIAAKLDQPQAEKETTASMRALLAAGGTLEISGYELHAELVRAIDAARLAQRIPAAGSPLLWLEHVSADNPEASLPSANTIAAWAAAGRECTLKTFVGAQFWQVHERVVNAAVIEATSGWFAALHAEVAA